MVLKEIETTEVEKEFGFLDHVPIGMFVLRKDFVVLFWNNCLEDWTRIPRSKVVGTNIGTLFPHLHDPKYTGRLRGIFEGGPPVVFSSQLHQYIIPAPLRDGQLRIQRATITSVPASDGTGFHALVAIQDVTDLTHRIQEYRAMRDQALAETAGGKSEFSYEGDITSGTVIYFGREWKVKISPKQWQDLFNHFKGKTVPLGTSRTEPVGLGLWLQQNITKTAIASYVDRILEVEGYADLFMSGKAVIVKFHKY